MSVQDLLELIDLYLEKGDISLEAEIAVNVFFQDETAKSYPATMASGNIDSKVLTIYADALEHRSN